ncbi:MAG: ABC transporter permease [Blastocatellia bacterium]|nr:ABC transporter permease [Blastocatellia bacterium]
MAPSPLPNFVELTEVARQAFAALNSHRLRSSLTILGVIIGVSTVIGMVSIITGLNRAFAQQIESLGSNTIFVSKFDPGFRRTRTTEERQRKDLTVADGLTIAEEASAVLSVSPERRRNNIKIGFENRETESPQLCGAMPSYELTRSNYVADGRFFTGTDLEHRADICILGMDVVDSLFPTTDPVGKTVKLDGHPLRVVGVLERMGNFFGQSRDNLVLIPLTTFEKYYPDLTETGGSFFFVIVRPRSRAEVPRAVEQMQEILRRRRHVPFGAKDNFGISTQDSLLDIYNQLTGATAAVLTVVSAIALVIGGIGVMNIMLVSVVERTREIGIRKALGARRIDIGRQFLLEAIALTAIGGILGILIGKSISFLVNRFSPLPSSVPWWAILTGLGVSVFVGLVAGIYPALKAAWLPPIEALRYE